MLILNIGQCNVIVMSLGKNVVEKRLLDLLSEEILSTSEVARKLNMRREVTVGFLEALREQGKLQRIKVGRSTVYRTVKKHFGG